MVKQVQECSQAQVLVGSKWAQSQETESPGTQPCFLLLPSTFYNQHFLEGSLGRVIATEKEKEEEEKGEKDKKGGEQNKQLLC